CAWIAKTRDTLGLPSRSSASSSTRAVVSIHIEGGKSAGTGSFRPPAATENPPLPPLVARPPLDPAPTPPAPAPFRALRGSVWAALGSHSDSHQPCLSENQRVAQVVLNEQINHRRKVAHVKPYVQAHAPQSHFASATNRASATVISLPESISALIERPRPGIDTSTCGHPQAHVPGLIRDGPSGRGACIASTRTSFDRVASSRAGRSALCRPNGSHSSSGPSASSRAACTATSFVRSCCPIARNVECGTTFSSVATSTVAFAPRTASTAEVHVAKRGAISRCVGALVRSRQCGTNGQPTFRPLGNKTENAAVGRRSDGCWLSAAHPLPVSVVCSHVQEVRQTGGESCAEEGPQRFLLTVGGILRGGQVQLQGGRCRKFQGQVVGAALHTGETSGAVPEHGARYRRAAPEEGRPRPRQVVRVLTLFARPLRLPALAALCCCLPSCQRKDPMHCALWRGFGRPDDA
ncbi:MAG: hypothetical protein BJ554DRAFT_6114, partial [Olpidium bornovanus]